MRLSTALLPIAGLLSLALAGSSISASSNIAVYWGMFVLYKATFFTDR
jgi:hypothetical protein